MSDSYDEAIDYFTQHEDEISQAWQSPKTHRYGYLFGFLTPNRDSCLRSDGLQCGCPTSVKNQSHVAWTDELTLAILQDEYIPRYFNSMIGQARLDAMPYIADAQRLADKLLGRSEPNTVLLDVGGGI